MLLRQLSAAHILLIIPILSLEAETSKWDVAQEKFAAGEFGVSKDLFLEIADAGNERDQADALLMATRSAQQQGDAAAAKEISAQIPAGPHSDFAKMVALKAAKSWEELVKVADPATIDRWPEKLIFPAYTLRGEAYLSMTNYSAAAEAFAASQKYTISSRMAAAAIHQEISAAQQSGASPDELLALSQKIVDLAPKGGGFLPRAHMVRARIFADQGREEEALSEVKIMETFGARDPYWLVAAELTTGQVYESLGKAELAANHYQKVAAFPDAPPEMRSDANAGAARVASSTP